MRSKRTSASTARCYAPRRKTGVRQELYGLFLAHYAVRFLMAQAAMEAGLDPDRLSFTEGLFQLTEMLDLALTDGGQRRPSSRFPGACVTRCDTWSCQSVGCVSIGGRSSKSTTNINPRSGTCLLLNPLSRMSSFLTLSCCLIRLLPFSRRRSLVDVRK